MVSLLHKVIPVKRARIWLLLIAISCGGGEAPRELSPRTLAGKKDFGRRPIFSAEKLGLITDIQFCNGKVAVAGAEGLCLADSEFRRADCGTISVSVREPQIGSIPLTCDVFFVSQGSNEPAVFAFDKSGNVRWKRESEPTPGPLTLVKRNGLTEIAVIAGRSNLEILDAGSGKKLREMSGAYSGFIESGDLVGDNEEEILTQAEGMLSVRNGQGEIVASRKARGSLAVTRPATGKSKIVELYEHELKIHSLDVEYPRDLEFPSISHDVVLHVTAAAEMSTPRPLIGTLLAGRGGWHRTVLLIHDDEGKLLYSEILDGDWQVITPNLSQGGVGFVLGGRGRIDVITASR